MTDRLGEALAHWSGGLGEGEGEVNALDTLHFDALVAAARSWQALTQSKPRQLWSWSESGRRRVIEPGRFYVVPVETEDV